ncbi:DUF6715 family protein [Butyrivibrio sp. AE2032]|uniref:DUF6715 family protein n=1 Tax=Butyrivibrio sp. AE2032 TaxID=1458463 RepID=UPI000555238F|nr:DUF6715 family protein [Butyrivibrio sp. AE2032]
MEKGGAGSAIVKSIVLVVLGALVVLGVYMALTRTKKSPTEETYVSTVVDEFTTMNLEKNYPASSRKVVETFIRAMQVLYKEQYTTEQEDKIVANIAGLMDQELLDNNVFFEKDIKDDVDRKKKEDNTISNFEILQKREPDEYKTDGRWMCKVDAIYYMRMGTQGTVTVDYTFILRREEGSGNWKIYGWALKEENK